MVVNNPPRVRDRPKRTWIKIVKLDPNKCNLYETSARIYRNGETWFMQPTLIYLGQGFSGDNEILKTHCNHYCVILARAFWLGFDLSSSKGWSIWFVVVGPPLDTCSAACNWRVLILFAWTKSHLKMGLCRWTDTPVLLAHDTMLNDLLI